MYIKDKHFIEFLLYTSIKVLSNGNLFCQNIKILLHLSLCNSPNMQLCMRLNPSTRAGVSVCGQSPDDNKFSDRKDSILFIEGRHTGKQGQKKICGVEAGRQLYVR